MTADEYLRQLVNKNQVCTLYGNPAQRVLKVLLPHLKFWANENDLVASYYISGSNAKGTAIKGATDVDIFISIAPNTLQDLKTVYDSLYKFFRRRSEFAARKQKVSVGIKYCGYSVDLVPGKLQGYLSSDHSVFVNREAQAWRKTNISKHISLISGSGRTDEIMLLKIWRKFHGLEFPSIYLELVVLRALGSGSGGCLSSLLGSYTAYETATLAGRFKKILEFLSESLLNARIHDPANTNNVISDELTLEEKRRIAQAAKHSITNIQLNEWYQVIQ